MADASAIDFTYRYPFASHFGEVEGGSGLSLATCGARQEHPFFFSGRLREPRICGQMLLVLSDVVQTHFFLPRPRNLDPVVTSNPGMLRFEGFSGCCGVYARVDLPAAAFDRDIEGRGTTNVDFNNALRASLGRLRDDTETRLSVGRDGMELTRAGETVVEKKVKLPVRWIKGFSEVQAYQSQLELRYEITAAEARRFVRALPAGTGPKHTSYLVQSGASLRLTQVKRPLAIPLQGTNRIRVLEPLLSLARSVRLWCDDASGTSAWEICFAPGRFFFLMSPELYRGFSGEGQALAQLASCRWQEALPYVQAELGWQAHVDQEALSRRLGLPKEDIAAALAVLGTRGLAGFDVAAGAYFHRELPFDLEQVETFQPRLKDARRLLADGRVTLIETRAGGAHDLSVGGTGVVHHVRLRADGDRCTCPWFSKHQGDRGPCKHVLAARMFMEEHADEMEIPTNDAGRV